MRNLLIVLLLLAAGVLGLGFYQGWFKWDEAKFDKDKNAVKAKLDGKPKEGTGTVKGSEKAEDR